MEYKKEDSFVLFFEFLCLCLKKDAKIPANLVETDWNALCKFGKKQATLGVLFHGIKKLSGSPYRPNKEQIFKWYGAYSYIEQVSKQTYKDADALTTLLREKYGVRSCVLKGRANALMYPDPYMHASGDINLWTGAKMLDIIRISRELDSKGEIGYHHIELSYFKTPVEIHFFPSFIGNLWHEYKLRRHFDQCKENQLKYLTELPDGLGKIHTITDDFNHVFQLTHLVHHFFFEGIGLRRMIDYYCLLLRGFSKRECKETLHVLKDVGMCKFTAAIVYVTKEISGLQDKYLLLEPDDRIGKMLISEILMAGNFGLRNHHYSFADKSVYSQYFLGIYRNLHFAIDFPSEAIWGYPISRQWHTIYKAYLHHQLRRSPK